MQVSKDISIMEDVSPRKMTIESMQKDFDYEIAQNITKEMLNRGLLSIDEYHKISVLNQKREVKRWKGLQELKVKKIS
ncbi:MAG: SHOCT domain-containing protein [Oscillospiraceae bacterium]